MNLRFVVNQFGLLLLGLAGIMAALALVYFGIEAVLDHEVRATARKALLLSAGVGFFVGGALWYLTRKTPRTLGRREALLLVAMSWLIGAAFAALPFFLWANLSNDLPEDHPFMRFADCYFESMSGLTTTGATVLGGTPSTDIETMPRSLLLWRSTTHWLGGLGIVVLFVAVLPSLGVGAKKLFRIEATGTKQAGLQPQIRETARVLWFIYLGLTIVEAVALRLVGMDWFDSICHTFSTVSTGGLSPKNASIGTDWGPDVNSHLVRIIITVFMFLAAVNFGLYYQLIKRRAGVVFRDVELRLFLALALIGAVVVFLSIFRGPITWTTGEVVEAPSTGLAIEEALFTTVALKTGTGFCTSDYDAWPFLCQAVLIPLMFMGGCAGSTAGGLKIIRVWIVLRVMLAEIEKVFRPNVVRTVRVGGGTIDPDVKLAALAYTLGLIVLVAAGGVTIMLIEQLDGQSTCDFRTASTASLATLCNIGPGFGGVGATANYGWFTPASKYVMCVLMALGRLEMFAIIVLFTPRFWRGD